MRILRAPAPRRQGSSRLRTWTIVVAALASVLPSAVAARADAGPTVAGHQRRLVVVLNAAKALAGRPERPLVDPRDPAADAGRGALIDPALGGVSVFSPAHTAAQRHLAAIRSRLDRETFGRAQILRALGDLLLLRTRTEADLAAATDAVAAAERAFAVAEAHLVLARQAERRAASRLEHARAEVRALAVAAYIDPLAPTGAAFVEDPAEVLRAGVRRTMADAVGADKLARVVRRERKRRHLAATRRRATDLVTAARAALADARRHEQRTATALVDVVARIDDTRVADARQAQVVERAAADRDDAEAGVLDARVLSAVAGADFPLVALDAYWKAAAAAPCPATWAALAGIGRTESGHGTAGGSTLDRAGRTTRPIVGIALDGAEGTALVGDTDGGRLDGDAARDRAVGPMQFIPSTWARWGADGDGDGRHDPQDLYDAALAAARYLCAASGDLRSNAGLHRAYLAYNHSEAYVSIVLARARAYEAAVDIPPPPT